MSNDKKRFLESEIERENRKIEHFSMKLELMQEGLQALENKLEELNTEESE